MDSVWMNEQMNEPLKAAENKAANIKLPLIQGFLYSNLHSFWDDKKKPTSLPTEQPQTKSPFLTPHNKDCLIWYRFWLPWWLRW